jgi:hypothetical protein
MVRILKVRRVCYGKPDTPVEYNGRVFSDHLKGVLEMGKMEWKEGLKKPVHYSKIILSAAYLTGLSKI